MWFWKSKTQKKLDELLDGHKIIVYTQLLLSKKLDKLEKLLSWKPGPISITITGERREGMVDRIHFRVDLPPKSAPDVVERELTVTIGENEREVFSLGSDEIVVEDLEGDQDSTVEVVLVDIDDAGNRSPSRTAVAVLEDTIAPPQPGELGVSVTGESHGSSGDGSGDDGSST